MIGHWPVLLPAILLDLILGDPHWMPHPVRWMGAMIAGLENMLRDLLPKTPGGERLGGILMALLVGGAFCGGSALLLWGLALISPWLAWGVEVWLTYQLLAARALVLEPTRRVVVQLPRGNRKHLYLSVDGGKAIRLTGGERVEITRSQYKTQLVQLSGRSFYEIINQKLGGYAP